MNSKSFRIYVKNFFFFRDKTLHSSKQLHDCIFGTIALNTRQSYPECSAIKTSQDSFILKQPNYLKNKNKTSPILRKKHVITAMKNKSSKIPILQTLLNRMKDTPNEEQPISEFDQATFLANLYQFFELKTKNIQFKEYIEHKIFPNSSHAIYELYYSDMETLASKEEKLFHQHSQNTSDVKTKFARKTVTLSLIITSDDIEKYYSVTNRTNSTYECLQGKVWTSLDNMQNRVSQLLTFLYANEDVDVENADNIDSFHSCVSSKMTASSL